MVDQPDNLVLQMLRDIRVTQGDHSADLTVVKDELRALKEQVEEQGHQVTYALGMIVNSDRRSIDARKTAEGAERRIDALMARLEALETR